MGTTITRNQRNLPEGLLTRAASFRPNSVDEKAHTIEAVITTEDPARFWGYDEILLVSGFQQETQVPLIKDHQQRESMSVIGSATEFKGEKDELAAKLFFDTELGPEVDALWKRVSKGHLRRYSIGYRYDNGDFVTIAAGQTAIVGGRSFTAGKRDLRVVTKWYLDEVSTVVVPADRRAQSRSNDSQTSGTQQDGSQNSHVDTNSNQNPSRSSEAMHPIITRLRTLGLPQNVTDVAEALRWFAERREQFEAQVRTEVEGMAKKDGLTIPEITQGTRSADGSGNGNGNGGGNGGGNSGTTNNNDQRGAGNGNGNQADPILAERERQRGIREMAQLAGPAVTAEMVQRACDEGWTEQRARSEFATAARASRGGQTPGHAPAGHTNNGSQHITQRTIMMALAIRHGVMFDSEHLSDPQTRQSVMINCRGHEFVPSMARQLQSRGAPEDESLARQFEEASRMAALPHRDMVRVWCELNNVNPGYDPEDMMRAAMSTANFEAVLSTVTHLLVLQGFADEPDTLGWVFQTDVGDFRDNQRARMGGVGQLKKLGKNGGTAAILNADDPRVEKYAIERHAGQLIFDERFIYNDAFGIAEQNAQAMGMQAARLPKDLVYAAVLRNIALSDTVAFFHSTRNNLFSQALDVEGLRSVKAAMPKVKGVDGLPCNVRPEVLLMGEDLSFAGDRLLSSAELRNTTSNKEYGTNNPHRGTLRPIVESRLDTGCYDPDSQAFVAGKPLRWYTVGSQNYRPVELGWLAGTGRRPRIRRSTLDKGQWGLHLDCVIDVGCKLLTPEVMNASDQP